MSPPEDVKFSNVRGLYLRKYGTSNGLYFIFYNFFLFPLPYVTLFPLSVVAYMIPPPVRGSRVKKNKFVQNNYPFEARLMFGQYVAFQPQLENLELSFLRQLTPTGPHCR